MLHDARITRTLNQLLDANVRFALDGRGTTNHCPMALCALAGMGATVGRLQAYFDMWEKRFALPAPTVATAIAMAEWPNHVGDLAAFGVLRMTFETAVHAQGAGPVLEEVFLRLPFAPATGAFHAMIRIAYGLEAGHAGEIAAGLAAMVTTRLIVDCPTERAAPVSAAAGLEQLSRAFGGRVFAGSSITSRLRAVSIDPLFCAQLTPPPPVADLLNAMAPAAIALYLQTRNFTALHIVTSLHALRIIRSYLEPQFAQTLMAPMWVAACAAYVAIGSPSIDGRAALVAPKTANETAAPENSAWPALLSRAVESDDDHVVKMVYTCWREHAREPLPAYLTVAACLVA